MKSEIITSPFIFSHWLYGQGRREPPTRIAIDTETTSLVYTKLDIVGFSLCDGKRSCYVDVVNNHRHRLLSLLSFYLTEYKPLMIFHNAAFDIMVLKKVGVL